MIVILASSQFFDQVDFAENRVDGGINRVDFYHNQIDSGDAHNTVLKLTILKQTACHRP